MNKKYAKSIHREQKSKPCDVPQKETNWVLPLALFFYCCLTVSKDYSHLTNNLYTTSIL
jgi:hypothetical protein